MTMTTNEPREDLLQLAGMQLHSRLMVGTGLFKDLEETRRVIETSGAEIVTVSIRRLPGRTEAADLLPLLRELGCRAILPNTAGCYTARDAVYTCELARELLEGSPLCKLEVLGDRDTLHPNVMETLQAAETLVYKGFQVMAYTSDDPVVAKELEAIGCVAVMPLGAPIGSGLGIRNPINIRRIAETLSVPVLVDAGVGTASDAAEAMELGCDAVLMNSALAGARDPERMAWAMRHAVIAGRSAYRAGRIAARNYGVASSPEVGTAMVAGS